MATIPLPEAITGALCGLSLYPLFLAIYRALQRRRSLVAEEHRLRDTTFILSAPMSPKAFVESVMLLVQQKRQGVLHLFLGRRKGYMLFRDSAVIDINYRNHSGSEALEEILSEESGEFFFESRIVHQPRLLFESIDVLFSDLNQETESITHDY